MKVVAVGRLSDRNFKAAAGEYVKRLSSALKIEFNHIREIGFRDGFSQAERDLVREREGQEILGRLEEGSYIIALDRKGESISSEDFADLFANLALHGRSSITFIIGGPLGLHSKVLERADKILSFSAMTFPHQLMILILSEQIYRAVKIWRGEPYHY